MLEILQRVSVVLAAIPLSKQTPEILELRRKVTAQIALFAA